MNVLNCPQCGATLEFERIASAPVKCPYCNPVVVVPAELRPAPPRPEPQPTTSYDRSEQAHRVFLSIIGAVAVILGIVMLVALFIRSSNKPRAGGVIPTYTPRLAPTTAPTPK